MNRRINITLPEETIQIMDQVAEKGNRSRLISEAVKHYVKTVGRKRLRELLKEGALHRAERDLDLVQEWFTLEEEAWQRRKK